MGLASFYCFQKPEERDKCICTCPVNRSVSQEKWAYQETVPTLLVLLVAATRSMTGESGQAPSPNANLPCALLVPGLVSNRKLRKCHDARCI